jgi:hypothetical protein
VSLDVELRVTKPVTVFEDNITHNLGDMAEKAGVYNALWHPEELGVTRACYLVPYLKNGLERLKAQPEYFKTLNPENGWGNYDNLVEFIEKYMIACKENPNAEIWVSV